MHLLKVQNNYWYIVATRKNIKPWEYKPNHLNIKYLYSAVFSYNSVFSSVLLHSETTWSLYSPDRLENGQFMNQNGLCIYNKTCCIYYKIFSLHFTQLKEDMLQYVSMFSETCSYTTWDLKMYPCIVRLHKTKYTKLNCKSSICVYIYCSYA